MQKIIVTAKCLLLMLAMTVTGYATNIAETYGISASGIARGNAMTASVNDWSSVFYNMAGLGRTYGSKGVNPSGRSMSLAKSSGKGEKNGDKKTYANELSFSFLYTMPVLSIDLGSQRYYDYIDQGTGDTQRIYLDTNGANDLDFGSTVIGLALDLNLIAKLPHFISSARMGVGMGMNADLSAAKLSDIDLKTHNFMRYGREAQKAVIMAGAGFGFLKDTFGVGLGINVSFAGEGKVLMKDVQVTESPQEPAGQAMMDLTIAPSVVAGVYMNAARLLPVLEGLEVGLSFRQESYLEMYPFAANALTEAGEVNMSMMLAIFDYYSPHSITAGVSYSKWGLTASFDLEVQLWSGFKISQCFERYYDGSDPQSRPKLPEMEDIFIPKLGVEYQVLDWLSVMGGYYLQPAFVPDSVTAEVFNLLDNTKHVISMGAVFDVPMLDFISGPIEISVAYQLQILTSRQVTKNEELSWNPDYAYGGTCHSVMVGAMLKL